MSSTIKRLQLGMIKNVKELPIIGRAMDGFTTYMCHCGHVTTEEDTTIFNGEHMCEGCAETKDLFSHDDPHGRNWMPE